MHARKGWIVVVGRIAPIACGIVSSLLTALAVGLIDHFLNFDVTAWFVWFLVPVGATIVGIAAGLGYYFGAVRFGTRLTGLGIAQMMLISGLTLVLIYYEDYMLLKDAFSGWHLYKYLTFENYLNEAFTQMHFQFASTEIGKAGQLGYFVFVIQLAGVLAGTIIPYSFLRSEPFCSMCNKFLRFIGTRKKFFERQEELDNFREQLRAAELGSEHYNELMTRSLPLQEGASKVLLETCLSVCPECKQERLKEMVKNWDGVDWQEHSPDTTNKLLPERISLVPLYLPKKKQ